MPQQTPAELSFFVAPPFDGYLLRDFLARMGVSSGLARQVKRAGGFFAADRPLRTCDRVAAGMTVRFALPPEPPTTVAAEHIPLRIVYESAHAVVLDKPAGMAVHPTLNYAGGTLANAWMGLLEERGETGVFRPVNRIDCNTSGLVLCAKNAFAAPLLAQSAEKWYLALVQGVPPEEKGVIDAPIGRAPGSIILRCVCGEGKPSRTEYEVVRRCGPYTLVKARTLTGRTHQLRVHFSHVGCPLAGDDLYGGSRTDIGRHALHCGCIRFTEPASGETVQAESPLPADMAALAENVTGILKSCEKPRSRLVLKGAKRVQ